MAIGATVSSSDGRQRVLVGFAESLAAIEVVWSLSDAGFEVAAFTRRGSFAALRRSRRVHVFDIAAPEDNLARSLYELQRLIGWLRPQLVMPLDDIAMWLSAEARPFAAHLVGPRGRALMIAIDKLAQVESARLAGFQVPATTAEADLRAVTPTTWPVVVKPQYAVHVAGATLRRPAGVVCADTYEFQRARERLRDQPVLLQPLIRGIGEGLFGFVDECGVHAWSAHRRIRMVNPAGSASSACESIPVDRALVESAERFLRSVEWRGMFMIELLRDHDGIPWFMELNGRPWGSMALARRRGFEYPAWAARAALEPGFRPTPPANPPRIRARHLGLELLHVAFVARGRQSKSLTEWPRLGATLRAVVSRSPQDRIYNWRRDEPQLLFADIWQAFREYSTRLFFSRRRRGPS